MTPSGIEPATVKVKIPHGTCHKNKKRCTIQSVTIAGSARENRTQTHGKLNGLTLLIRTHIKNNIPHVTVVVGNDLLQLSDMLGKW
jgi:hypothetical protein